MTASNRGTTDMAQIEGRMPDSLKTDGFADALGRTFACPECGAPSKGECEECGHVHQKFRENPNP